MTDDPHAYADGVDERSGRPSGVVSHAPDEGYVCADCDARWFYARARCRDCGGADHATYELGVGTLLATTTTRVTPADVRDENPLGLAEFDESVTVLAQLSTGERRPAVGDAVALVGTARLRDGVRGARLRVTESDPSVGTPDERPRRREGREP